MGRRLVGIVEYDLDMRELFPCVFAELGWRSVNILSEWDVIATCPTALIVDHGRWAQGIEFLRDLRLALNGRTIPTVLTSSLVPPMFSGFIFGVRAFLAKPYELQALLEAVDRLHGDGPRVYPEAARAVALG